MNCPKCQSIRLSNGGKTPAGNPRYQCLDCGCKFTPASDQGKAGRKLEGDRPLTNAERQRRWREKKSQDGG